MISSRWPRSSGRAGSTTSGMSSPMRRCGRSPSTAAWRCAPGTTSRGRNSTAARTWKACGVGRNRPRTHRRPDRIRHPPGTHRPRRILPRRRHRPFYAGLRLPFRIAGILALSTYLPGTKSLGPEAHDANRDVPIFLAHGSQDPIIALALSERSRAAMAELGYTVETHTYPMPHSVVRGGGQGHRGLAVPGARAFANGARRRGVKRSGIPGLLSHT